MSWTDERIETLRRLWNDGLSASQIAAQLGGVTRNAVIGKIHRLGLSGRVKAPKAARSPQRRASPARGPAVQRVMAVGSAAVKVVEQEAPAPLAVLPAEGEVVPLHARLTLLELTPNSCRWPVGDPADDTFGFCGAPTCGTDTYCKAHTALAGPKRNKPKR